jgi:hypothetical protein
MWMAAMSCTACRVKIEGNLSQTFFEKEAYLIGM